MKHMQRLRGNGRSFSEGCERRSLVHGLIEYAWLIAALHCERGKPRYLAR